MTLTLANLFERLLLVAWAALMAGLGLLGRAVALVVGVAVAMTPSVLVAVALFLLLRGLFGLPSGPVNLEQAADVLRGLKGIP